MVMYCSAFGCTSKAGTGKKVSFHKFPAEETLRKEWIVAMKREQFNPKLSTRICSDHFKEEDFEYHFGQKKIKYGVVPSIFNFPGHLKKKEPKPRSTSLKVSSTESASSPIPSTSSTAASMSQEVEVLTCTKPELVLQPLQESMSSRKRKRSQPVYMGDFSLEDLENPRKCRIMWRVANETIGRQKKRITYLESRLNRLTKKVNTLNDLIVDLKGNHKISPECSSKLKVESNL